MTHVVYLLHHDMAPSRKMGSKPKSNVYLLARKPAGAVNFVRNWLQDSSIRVNASFRTACSSVAVEAGCWRLFNVSTSSLSLFKLVQPG